jgi:hypothetical protein
MIRPLTLVTMVAAMGAGLHVYQTKHAVAQLDKQLRGIARQIQDENERSLALSAEWAWLNEPERLRQAANRHLALEPMMPGQFVRFAEFERRLPQVAAWDGPPALFAARDQRGAVQAPNGAMRLDLAERPPASPAPRVMTVATTPQPRAAETAPAQSPVTPAAPPGRSTVALPAVVPAAHPAEPPRSTAAQPSEAPRPEAAPALAALSGLAVGAAAAAAPARAEARPAPAVRPRPAPRPAPELASATRSAEPPRMPATISAPATAPAPAPAFAASIPPVQPVGSLLGGGARTALAPPVPHGALPPPVPFASASAPR